MQNNVDVKAAMLAYLKSLSTVVALLSGSKEIKEAQWQGTEFVYPAIRVSLDYRPSINGCGPDDADFTIEAFSEKQSSLEADTISGTMANLLHKHPFISNGMKFPTVIVTKIQKAERSIYGWRSQIDLRTQVS